MKWFMSYVQVWSDGRFQFGCVTYECSAGHPIEKIKRWNKEHGKNECKFVLLSFQEIDYSTPDIDELSCGIS